MPRPSPPAVSILMPFRDAGEWFADCLDSIAAQTFTDYELVAVNDHSGDASVERLQARAVNDPRIRLLHNPGHGLVDALNHGLGHCRAPLVARMDADDLMHAERLALQHAHMLEHPRLAVLGSRVAGFPEEAMSDGFREYLRWQNGCLTEADFRDEMFVESPLAHPSVMFRRQAVTDAGGYRSGDLPEDYELWLRLHHRGESFAKLPQVLVQWRESDGRATRTDPRYRRELFDRVRADYLARDARVRERRDELVIWGAGRRTRQRCRLLLEQGFEPRAWIDIDPRKIGNRLRGVPVVDPAWLRRTPRPLVLVYVTNHGAREAIAGALRHMHYRRGEDYLMVG